MRNNWKISKIDLSIFLLLFPFLEPWWFTTIGWLDFLYDAVKLLICAYVIILILKKKAKLTVFSTIYAVYRIYIFCNTLVQETLSIGYLSESIQYICFIILLEYFISKYGIRVLKSVLFGFCIILVLNLITYSPNGIVFEPDSEYFLLGIRTRIADLSIPAMGLSLYYCESTKKGKMMLYYVFGTSIIFFVLQWVATALLCTALFFILLALERLVYKKFKNMYYLILICLGIVISCGIVFFDVQSLFGSLIENVLHKELTLTGRTEIWAVAIPQIAKKWLFGYGFQNQGDFVALYDFVTTSHNQLLQTMYYGGVIGCVLYFALPVLAIKNNMNKHMQINSLDSKLLISLIVLIVMSTTEICMDNIYYLVLTVFIYHCRKIGVQKTEDNIM